MDAANVDNFKKNTGWLILFSVLLVITGIFSLAAPFTTTITSTLLFGGIYISAGVFRIIHAFQSRETKGFLLKLVIGLLYAVGGLFLLFYPLEGAVTLTFVLAVMLISEGIFESVLAFQIHPHHSPDWLMLANGVVTLGLGAFIVTRFPLDTFWVIGTYVGISIIFSGVSLLMNAIAFRNAPPANPPASPAATA